MRSFAFLLLFLGGCSARCDAGPECRVCSPAAPYWRACAETDIATGGQLVCQDEGRGDLCESPARCCELAGLRLVDGACR